jgi:choline dehydrogenase-like flavoprotein
MLIGAISWVETAKDVGLPVRKSHNAPDTPAMGIFTIDSMIDNAGLRLSANKAYLPLSTVNERRNRLTLCTGTVATKLKLSDDGRVVEGVYLVDASPNKKNSRQCLVKARREVIATGGALFSPQLLMLSDIGPRQELEAHSIAVAKHLPGVGSNLMDHTSIGVTIEIEPRDSYNGLVNPLFVLWQIILWLVFRTGLFSSTTTKECIWVRSGAISDETMQVSDVDENAHSNLDGRDIKNIPDIELILSSSSLYYKPRLGKGYFGVLAVLAQPFSRGKIMLKSDDPLQSPSMHYPYIQHEQDWMVARKAVRFSMHLLERFRKQGYPFKASWQNAPGMKTDSVEGSWRDVSDEEIDEFVRKGASSGLHPTSTCRMGTEAEGGVVGQDLKVHGFKNLRVADASSFPTIPSAHPVAAVYMVAERCADFIKKEYSS